MSQCKLCGNEMSNALPERRNCGGDCALCVIGCGDWQLALDVISALIEQRKSEPEPVAWVVADGGNVIGEHRFRTMKNGWPEWTLDREEAIQFARRKDAEAFAAEDEDAWSIQSIPTAPPAATVPDDEQCQRILETKIGLDPIASLVRGDTMAAGVGKVDVIRAILTAAQKAQP